MRTRLHSAYTPAVTHQPICNARLTNEMNRSVTPTNVRIRCHIAASLMPIVVSENKMDCTTCSTKLCNAERYGHGTGPFITLQTVYRLLSLTISFGEVVNISLCHTERQSGRGRERERFV